MNRYKKAAKILVEHNLRDSCTALFWAERGDIVFGKDEAYFNTFSPDKASNRTYWWGFMKTKESQMARSLALLFMAEMSQEEIKNN